MLLFSLFVIFLLLCGLTALYSKPDNAEQSSKGGQLRTIRARGDIDPDNWGDGSTGIFSFEPIGFCGNYKKSPNGLYMFAWSDMDNKVCLVTWSTPKGNPRLLWQKRRKNPWWGDVADNGISVCDVHNLEKLTSRLIVQDPAGNLICEFKLLALLDETHCALSPDGRYLVAVTASNNREDYKDDSQLVLFDVLNRREVWRRERDYLDVKSIEFARTELIYQLKDGTLFAINLFTGEPNAPREVPEKSKEETS